MLTARGDETDRILGLEMGADDYLSKPFSARELLARIEVVLKRVRSLPPNLRPEHSRWLGFAGWQLDTAHRHLLSPAGVVTPLSGAEYRLHKLGQYVRGWMGYFGISEYYRPVPELEEWIRRRIRMCYWKQWRWMRTKIRNLLNLGVSLQTAIQHRVSSKSYWHMARTPALQQALSNAWLKAQGLVSVKDRWCKAQGYAN